MLQLLNDAAFFTEEVRNVLEEIALELLCCKVWMLKSRNKAMMSSFLLTIFFSKLSIKCTELTVKIDIFHLS